MSWTLALTNPLKVPLAFEGKKFAYTFKLVCTCDGSALSSTAFSAMTGFDSMTAEAKEALRFGRLMSLTSVPGTGGVVPDATYNVTIYNGLGASILAATSRSTTAIEIAYPSNYTVMQDAPTLAVGDLGTSGDQTTLYFEVWM